MLFRPWSGPVRVRPLRPPHRERRERLVSFPFGLSPKLQPCRRQAPSSEPLVLASYISLPCTFRRKVSGHIRGNTTKPDPPADAPSQAEVEASGLESVVLTNAIVILTRI